MKRQIKHPAGLFYESICSLITYKFFGQKLELGVNAAGVNANMRNSVFKYLIQTEFRVNFGKADNASSGLIL